MLFEYIYVILIIKYMLIRISIYFFFYIFVKLKCFIDRVPRTLAITERKKVSRNAFCNCFLDMLINLVYCALGCNGIYYQPLLNRQD